MRGGRTRTRKSRSRINTITFVIITVTRTLSVRDKSLSRTYDERTRSTVHTGCRPFIDTNYCQGGMGEGRGTLCMYAVGNKKNRYVTSARVRLGIRFGRDRSRDASYLKNVRAFSSRIPFSKMHKSRARIQTPLPLNRTHTRRLA